MYRAKPGNTFGGIEMIGIIMGVMSALSTAMSVVQQNQMVDAQNKANAAQLEQQYKAIAEEQEQAQEQASIEEFERTRQALREMGRARVSGAESGALGNSLGAIFNEVGMDQMLDLGLIEANLENTMDKTELQKESAYSATKHSMSEGTNPLYAGLQIGASGYQGYQMGSSLGGKKTKIKSKVPRMGDAIHKG
jgi:hypothetical protein